MKTIRYFLSISALSFLLYSCQKERTEVPGNENNTNYNVDKALLLQLVNNARTSGYTCGNTYMPPVTAVTWNDLLAQAAYNHSRDMNLNNYFNHNSQNGATPGDRIRAVGYNWTAYGENIALNYPNEQAVVNGWLSSEGHCKNIMNGNFREMGVGKDGGYWTQNFGTR